MEYNLQKKIEPNLLPQMPNSTYPVLTSYPAFDYINPGLGQISRLYSFYVPLFNDSNVHKIEKEINGNESNQSGAGKNEIETTQIGTGKNDETSEIQLKNDDLIEDPEKFNERKRKILGDGLFDSFLHPKTPFKIKKISLEKPKKKVEKNEKTQNQKKKSAQNDHNFQFY